MADTQRDNAAPEDARRQDGGGETGTLPGSEEARGNAPAKPGLSEPGEGAETWTPGAANRGVRPGSDPAEATGSGSGAGGGGSPEDYDSDPKGGGGAMPTPASSEVKPDSGADASSHGSR